MTSANSKVGGFLPRKRGLRSTLIEAILLMGLWLVLSGHYDLLHIGLGLFSVIAVLLFNAKLSGVQLFQGDVSEWERFRFGRFIIFVPWFLREIIRASLQVAAVVLNPRMPVEPTLIRFRVVLPSVGAKVLLGNVITLTPGTVTLSIQGDEFLIHSLRKYSASGIIDGTTPARIAQLFQESAEAVLPVTVIESGDDA